MRPYPRQVTACGDDGQHHVTGARFANGLKRFVTARLLPVLDAALRQRHLTAAVGVGVMIVTVGLVLSGRPGFASYPPSRPTSSRPR